MKYMIGRIGTTREKQRKIYSVIVMVINSIQTKSVKKRFLNFYDPILPSTIGAQTNESKRVL